ncbi:MAG: hypothetical protein M3238_00875 [Actinomycetota bacterium]|nr:hypothetical protein [Actinomycetota bacterium]
MRKVIVAAVFVLTLGTTGAAFAADVADNQGFCKKQGSSSCAGGSECSTAHQSRLPRGQAKKC